jgi:acetyl esterase/lipase
MQRMSHAQRFSSFVEFVQAHPPKAITPAAIRGWLETLMGVNPVPPEAKLEPAGASVPASWVSPEGVDPGRVILYLHGGGYLCGSSATHLELVHRFAKAAKARALSVDYRLAPENPWPAGRDDCVAAYRWLLAKGVRPERIAIAGDSAGGGLAVSTLLELRDAGDPLPACAVCFSPWVDFTGSGESMKTNAGKDPTVDPAGLSGMTDAVLQGRDPASHSPLFADLSRLPQILVQAGGEELLLDDARRLVEKSNAAGGNHVLDVWEGMTHVFQGFPVFFSEAIPAVERAAEFVRVRTG